MNINRTGSDSEDELAEDLLPLVRAFVKQMASKTNLKTALDFAKALLDTKVFETIDNALVLGYLFEYLLEGEQARTESFSWLLSKILAQASLETSPSIEFVFSILQRTEKGSICKKTYFEFLKLYSKLFYPEAEKQEEVTQLVSFVFRKNIHQKRVAHTYLRLKLIGSGIEDDVEVVEELVRQNIIETFDTNTIFKSQMKSLYSPVRKLCLHVMNKVNPNEVIETKQLKCESIECLVSGKCTHGF